MSVFEKQRTNARVAQWWSIALPRRGPRVRIPSRAFFVRKNGENCKEKEEECDDVLAREEHSSSFSLQNECPRPS